MLDTYNQGGDLSTVLSSNSQDIDSKNGQGQ